MQGYVYNQEKRVLTVGDLPLTVDGKDIVANSITYDKMKRPYWRVYAIGKTSVPFPAGYKRMRLSGMLATTNITATSYSAVGCSAVYGKLWKTGVYSDASRVAAYQESIANTEQIMQIGLPNTIGEKAIFTSDIFIASTSSNILYCQYQATGGGYDWFINFKGENALKQAIGTDRTKTLGSFWLSRANAMFGDAYLMLEVLED